MNSGFDSQHSIIESVWRHPLLLIFLALLVSLGSSPSFLRADSLSQSHKKPSGSLRARTDSPPKTRPRAQDPNEPKAQPSTIRSRAEPSPKGAFFEGRAEGWHWYQDPLRESDQSLEINDLKEENLNPTQIIENQRKKLEQKLHAAIIEPTRENLIAYILAQRALMDQSQRFSEEWKKVVMTIPSLDETLIHPVDQNARHVYYSEQNKELSKRIKTLANEYGLFFFFRKNCPYCHYFAPIVKRFSQKYGWSVLAISLDGGSLSEFPNVKRDNGISKRLGVSHVPALIALHPKSGQLIPLAYGMVSENEIEARIELLTKISQTHGAGK